MNFRRCLFLTFALFSFVFASCADMASDAASFGGLGTAVGAPNGGAATGQGQPSSTAQKYLSVKGSVSASGAFPQDIADALQMTGGPAISASAFPTVSASDFIGAFYKISAVKVGDESVHYDAAEDGIVKTDGAVTYGLNIPLSEIDVEYKIRCEAYLDNAKTKAFLLGESEKFKIGPDSQAASADVAIAAIQEAGSTGEIGISVAPEAGLIDSAIMTIGDTGLTAVASVAGSSCSFSCEDVPCGSHLVRFSFKKEGKEVYAFSQPMNVFKNLVTETWVQNGAEPYFETTTDASGKKSTVCKLTAALLEGWKLTEIFVDPSRSSDPTKPNYTSQSGSFINPCVSFETALSKLVDKNKDYTIFINGTLTGALAVPSTLKSDGSGETNARSLTISGYNGLYTSGPNAGQPKDTIDADGLGSALCAQTTVPVSIKDLRITGADDDGVSGLSIQDVGVDVTLLGGTLITGNQADNGGGVYISAGSLAIKGAVISGNSATDSGGGIYNEGGSVTFYSGSIESNSAICYGGGVCNDSGSFEMKDGAVITQNSANDGLDGSLSSGGGIFVYGGSVTVSGGTISANTTNGLGGAVRVFDGAFSVGGSASIPCGTGNDVYLDEDQSIAIASAITASAPVATITPSAYTDGTPLLSAADGVTLSSETGKFAVTPEVKGDGSVVTWYISGDGKLTDVMDAVSLTEENYDSITKVAVTNAAGLETISSLSNTSSKDFDGKTIILKEDVSISSSFTPIGTNKGFKGTFDGNSKTLSISNTVVFKKLGSGSTVKNLNLAGSTNKGFALASGDVSGTIEYCTSTVRITDGGSVGGLVYEVSTYGIVRYCVNKGSIDLRSQSSSASSAGGIAYRVYGGTIDRCINEASITVKNTYCGGIAGSLSWHGTILNCKNTGSVSTSQSKAGGLVGYSTSDAYGIKNCSSSNGGSTDGSVAFIIGSVSNSPPIENTCDQTYYHKSNTEKSGYSGSIDTVLVTLNEWAESHDAVRWKKSGSKLELDLSW